MPSSLGGGGAICHTAVRHSCACEVQYSVVAMEQLQNVFTVDQLGNLESFHKVLSMDLQCDWPMHIHGPITLYMWGGPYGLLTLHVL